MRNYRIRQSRLGLLIVIFILCVQSFNAFAHPPKDPHFERAHLEGILSKLNLSDYQEAEITKLLEKEKSRKEAAKIKAQHLSQKLQAINLTNDERKKTSQEMVSIMTEEKNIWFRNMMDVYLLLNPDQAKIFISEVPTLGRGLQHLQNSDILKKK